jgi:hypothetical protein
MFERYPHPEPRMTKQWRAYAVNAQSSEAQKQRALVLRRGEACA